MPQLKAAKKALRVSKRRRAINDRWRGKLRRSLHAVRDAITSKDAKAAEAAVSLAERILDSAARRNIIHRNKADRKKSRLRKSITSIAR